MSTESDELLPAASENNGSFTSKLVVATVVVVPLTVKLPAIVTLSGRPRVTVLPETAVVTSFVVPLIVSVSPPLTAFVVPLSAAIL